MERIQPRSFSGPTEKRCSTRILTATSIPTTSRRRPARLPSTRTTAAPTQDRTSGAIYFTDASNIYKLSGGVATNFTADYLSYPPQILAMGPDGNLWYTYSGGTSSNESPVVCKISLSADIGYYNPSCTTNTLQWSINSFEFGPDGALWLVGADEQGKVQILRNTTAGMQSYFSGVTCCPVSNGIATGSDGAIWIATTGGVNRLALTQAEAATARGGAARSSLPKAFPTPRPRQRAR
jgi:streptogramin lyase